MDYEINARHLMIEQQIRPWEVLDQGVLNLLYKVKREDFVPPVYRSLAFVDSTIPLGGGESMWEPKLEARVLQALAIQRHERVQHIWDFTMRADFAFTPNLTFQYYGSPFIGTGRYTEFKQATDTPALRYQDRFHLYSESELSFLPDSNTYFIREAAGGATYSFTNPDFSFRQFRSNFVARWEYRPGSTLYVVWSQGRTSEEQHWDSSFSSNWNALWRERPDNIFLVKLTYWVSP